MIEGIRFVVEVETSRKKVSCFFGSRRKCYQTNDNLKKKGCLPLVLIKLPPNLLCIWLSGQTCSPSPCIVCSVVSPIYCEPTLKYSFRFLALLSKKMFPCYFFSTYKYKCRDKITAVVLNLYIFSYCHIWNLPQHSKQVFNGLKKGWKSLL